MEYSCGTLVTGNSTKAVRFFEAARALHDSDERVMMTTFIASPPELDGEKTVAAVHLATLGGTQIAQQALDYLNEKIGQAPLDISPRRKNMVACEPCIGSHEP